MMTGGTPILGNLQIANVLGSMMVSIHGGYTQMDGLSWKLPLKWMILGYTVRYTHSRKPPYCHGLSSSIHALGLTQLLSAPPKPVSHGKMQRQ